MNALLLSFLIAFASSTIIDDGHMKYKVQFSRCSRTGSATKTNSCHYVRAVPSTVRSQMGLSNFYQKYTEAYGLPIISNNRVTDSALKRACYIVRFMFADHAGARRSAYSRCLRFAVIAVNEGTSSIPEYSIYLRPQGSMTKEQFDKRYRGAGATAGIPVSSGGEENAMCWKNKDRYPGQDIVLHEFAHGLDLVGLTQGLSGFKSTITNLWRNAPVGWTNTYAKTNPVEFFAEGTQSFLNSNKHNDRADGIHGYISSYAAMKKHDPNYFNFMYSKVFPCHNRFILRCESGREAKEQQQNLKMDCAGSNPPPDGCENKSEHCDYWARTGECQRSADYMKVNCRKACKLC